MHLVVLFTDTKSSSEKQKRPLTDKNTHPEAKKRKVESQGVTRKGALLESSKKPKSANKENLMAAKAEVITCFQLLTFFLWGGGGGRGTHSSLSCY